MLRDHEFNEVEWRKGGKKRWESEMRRYRTMQKREEAAAKLAEKKRIKVVQSVEGGEKKRKENNSE